MEVQHIRCAGLDVHKDSVVACARIASDSAVQQSVETFATTTKGLLALSDWLSQHEVTHVAMEATGVYWKPVWHRRERRDVDRGPTRPRTDSRQLRAAIVDPGVAHAHPHPQAARAREGAARPADPKNSGGRQPQDRLGRRGHHGHERASDPRRPGGGRNRPGEARRPDPWPPEGQPRHTDRGAARTRHAASPFHAEATPRAH